MREFSGKTTFITGGASGIGYAMAEAFGARGMKVMIADIEPAKLAEGVAHLRDRGIDAAGVTCNVADRAAVEAAARETLARFGKVHLLCNNAGVTVGLRWPIGTVSERDWNWVIDVNLKGVIHGTEVFVPHMLAHGEGGHIVNTASMAGFVSAPGREPYHATKFAIVAASEGWRAQLAGKGIGVSVLCPGAVATRLFESARRRPGDYGTRSYDPAQAQTYKDMIEAGMAPEMVAARVIECVENNELYIFTHAEFRSALEKRFNAILAAMDDAAKSPALKDYKPGPPLTFDQK